MNVASIKRSSKIGINRRVKSMVELTVSCRMNDNWGQDHLKSGIIIGLNLW